MLVNKFGREKQRKLMKLYEKIQTYTADTLTINCKKDPYIIKGGLWDGYNYYQLYQEATTPWEWHQAIKDKCEEVGVDFLSTPFDNTAVDFLEELGVDFYKIASFELVDIPLIEYVASKGKPIVMSCGMGSIEEINEALAPVKPIKAGETFTKENVRSIRPAIGLKPKYYEELLGKKAKKEYEFGDGVEIGKVE